MLLIFAYGGFEAALISAGEAKDPRRDMPFGLFAALITCAVIYGLIQWVVVGVLPDPAHSERPLADVARIVMGHGGAALIAAGRAVFDLWLSERQHAGDAANYLRARRARRLPFCFRAGASALPHAVFFHLRVRGAGLAAGPVWQLCGERNAFGGIAALLLRSGLRRASGSAQRKQKTRATFHLPGGIALAVLGVLICAGLLTRIEYNKSLILAAAVAVAAVNWLVVRKRGEVLR